MTFAIVTGHSAPLLRVIPHTVHTPSYPSILMCAAIPHTVHTPSYPSILMCVAALTIALTQVAYGWICARKSIPLFTWKINVKSVSAF